MINARHPANYAAASAYHGLVARVRRLPFELQVRILMQALTNRNRRRQTGVKRGVRGGGFRKVTGASPYMGRMLAQTKRRRAARRSKGKYLASKLRG